MSARRRELVRRRSSHEGNRGTGRHRRPAGRRGLGDDASDPTQAINEAGGWSHPGRSHTCDRTEHHTSPWLRAPIYNQAKMLSITYIDRLHPKSIPYGFTTFYDSAAFTKALVEYTRTY